MQDEVFKKDMAAHFPPLECWKFIYRVKYPVLAWQRRPRRLEVLKNKSGFFAKSFFFLLKFCHHRDSIRLGFTIPLNVFGSGLSIAHWGTITVGENAIIGKNCRIHQGVTIGSSSGKEPVIGDNCFIGANASIIGDLVLGDNVKIGAGAVVIHSFGNNAILVGNPAIDRQRNHKMI